jgi:hypothetical protein
VLVSNVGVLYPESDDLSRRDIFIKVRFRKKNIGRKIITLVIGGAGAKQNVRMLGAIRLLDGDFPWIIIPTQQGYAQQTGKEK